MIKTSTLPHIVRSFIAVLGLACGLLTISKAQAPGPQQLSFAGLHSVAQQGQFNGVATDSADNLILLLDQGDGVRLLKTDAAATNVLAQASFGATGDQGLAMALDPSGNVYVTGQSTSGALSGSSGAAFVHPVDTSANSFVAKLDGSLNLQWITFGGSGRAPASAIAATADAVFITGLIYGNGLPVTPGGVTQAPATGSNQNGFVEKFSADGKTLLYATYLSGAKGDTSPLVIAADAQDDAFIAGFTTAPGYPTTPPGFPGTFPALIPRYVGNATQTGFLTELTPGGDGITLSTFIPGGGITSLAIDPSSNTLLLSGNVALGQFPVAAVDAPLAATNYQVLLRMPLDGSSVKSSTVLAPGTQSYLTPGPNGTVWVDGPLSTPLLPSPTVSDIGTAYALRVSPQGAAGQTVVDEAFRFGGLASSSPNYAGVATNLTSLAVDSTGSAFLAGGVAPSADASLLATQTFDLPLTNAPTTALPSAVHDAVVDRSTATGSSGAAYLARVTPIAGASLALSTDASPTILLRNLGSAQATGLQIALSGFTEADTCGTTLNAGQECTLVLSGSGPGTLTVSASNATAQTANLAAVPSSVTPQTLVFSPRELDFGIQTSTSPAQTRTITVSNLGSTMATFTSALNGLGRTPYTFAETPASDCLVSGSQTTKQLPAGATCHIVLSFAASGTPANDGPAMANWKIGTAGNVLLTGFAQAASLSLSSTGIDFGTQFYGGLTSPRFLYLSNNSATAIAHTAITTLSDPSFTVTDLCPSQLNPHSVCQIKITYLSTTATDTAPSTNAASLTLDQGLSVPIAGQTLPQPSVNGSTAPPSLSVTPSTPIAFPTPVPVTAVSSTTQTVVVQNTGTSSFGLTLSLTGDFIDQTNCTAVLAAGVSCNVILSFAPSQPGARTGLLGVTAGSGTSPAYVALSGTGTPILSANNGTLDFGGIPVAQPSVQWYKVSQPFSTLTAATLSPNFKAILIEDIGSGHGTPPSTSFLSATTGTCANCWLGLQFTPPFVGAQTASLKLFSALNGNPYVLALTGNGLPPTGVTLTPATANLGTIAVGSSSAPQTFTLTNLTGNATPIALGTPVLTSGFGLNAANTTCGNTLVLNASCSIAVFFAPTATGPRTGTLALQAGGTSVSAALTGSGLPDPSVAFNPNALIFNNVPGTLATQQTITVSNTGIGTLMIGNPSNANAAFQASTTCATLAPAATCTIAVTYIPGAALATDTLTVPVTGTVGGAPVTTTYPVALSATYTAATAGLQIAPNMVNVGPFPVNTMGGTRQFTVTNLTAKSLAINLNLPREFLLTGAPCTTLAPNGTCTFSATFVPVTAGDLTGTLTAQGIPTDGSAAVNGVAYLEGFGTGTNTLTITGNLSPGNLLNFGQVASGQTAQQTLTLTNTSTAGPITVHRVTSRFPYLSTTTCGNTLAPGDSCTVTLTYSPIDQIASGGTTPPPSNDTGTLTIESDALSSPNTINLAGTGSATAVSSPSNTAPTANFILSQNALTFAATAIGYSSAAQSVTLTNTGSSVLHVGTITASTDFTVSGNCATVLPAATCTLFIAFAPQVSALAPGARLGTVEIDSDSSASLEFLSLLGTAGSSTLNLQPASLAFGTVLLGATTSLPLQLTNIGTTPVNFTSITTTGDYAVSGSCGTTLAANASCTELISFTPTISGSRPGTASIVSSASSLPLVAQLSGAGAQTHLQISPATLSFGNVVQGTTTSLSLTLANNSTSTSITGLAFTATGDFVVTAPCAVTTLAPGASCSVTVAFTPTTVGTRTGTLTVASSDPASPLAIPLTGTGTGPVAPPGTGSFTLTASSPTVTVASSSPATYSLTVTPINGFTGQVVLNCAALVAAQYASCSLQPSSVTLNGTAPQTTSVTINTVTTARNEPPALRRMDGVTLCILAPAALLFWRFRRSLPTQRWPLLLALLCTSLMLLVSGCGSSGNAVSNLRKTPSGSYTYTVSASSTTGTVVSQSVTLSLVVQ